MRKELRVIQNFLPSTNSIRDINESAFENEGTKCNAYRVYLESGETRDVVLIEEGWSPLDLDDLIMYATKGRAIAGILKADGSTTYSDDDGARYKLVELRPEK